MSMELLPCPFCGTPAEIEQIEMARGADDYRWSVGCKAVDEDGEPTCIGYMATATYARKKDALAAWNRRANPAEARLAEADRDARMECEWWQFDEGSDSYSTACGQEFTTLEGCDGVDETMKFCCFCGGKLAVKPWGEEDEH